MVDDMHVQMDLDVSSSYTSALLERDFNLDLMRVAYCSTSPEALVNLIMQGWKCKARAAKLHLSLRYLGEIAEHISDDGTCDFPAIAGIFSRNGGKVAAPPGCVQNFNGGCQALPRVLLYLVF
jgi:hypothetical protein